MWSFTLLVPSTAAFAYALESVNAWQGSFDTGSIKIKLQDGLKIRQVKGLLPSNVWQSSNALLTWKFNYLELGADSNVLVWYKVGEDSIRFETEVLPRSTELFAIIDIFDRVAFEGAAGWPFIQKDDLSTGNGLLMTITGWFFVLFVISIVFIVGLIVYFRRRN